jgi:hypothetical protein
LKEQSIELVEDGMMLKVADLKLLLPADYACSSCLLWFWSWPVKLVVGFVLFSLL